MAQQGSTMSGFQTDRRLAERHSLKRPLRVHIWKSRIPEYAAESINISQRGIYFKANSPLSEGEAIEVFFDMPEEIIGEPSSEWRCTGHVVRVEPIEATGGKRGVGVQFDCYEVSRSKPLGAALATGTLARMMADIVP